METTKSSSPPQTPCCSALELNCKSERSAPPWSQTTDARYPENENDNQQPSVKSCFNWFSTTISWTGNLLTRAGVTPTRREFLLLLHSYVIHYTHADFREKGAGSPTHYLFNEQAQSFCALNEASVLWNTGTIFWRKLHRKSFIWKPWVSFSRRELSAQYTGSHTLKKHNYLEGMGCSTCSKKHDYFWQSLAPKK